MPRGIFGIHGAYIFHRVYVSAELLQIRKAFGAYVLALEYRYAAGVRAECAGGEILFQYDLVVLHINFQTVLDFDPQCSAEFNRYNDSPQIIDFPYTSC